MTKYRKIMKKMCVHDPIAEIVFYFYFGLFTMTVILGFLYALHFDGFI